MKSKKKSDKSAKEEYRTLEMDLVDCFKKRAIKVESISVEKGASLYIIKVRR